MRCHVTSQVREIAQSKFPVSRPLVEFMRRHLAAQVVLLSTINKHLKIQFNIFFSEKFKGPGLADTQGCHASHPGSSAHRLSTVGVLTGIVFLMALPTLPNAATWPAHLEKTRSLYS